MITEPTVNMTYIPRVQGLTDYEQDLLKRLYEVWLKKLPRNRIRDRYYRAKNSLKDLGIAIPPELKDMETALGWAAKAVDMLAVRSRFDGFAYKDDVDGIDEILKQNNFKLLYSQATISELKHSCSFITVSKGYENEPEVIISAYSAETAAAIWDGRKKRIEGGFTVVEVDDDSRIPTWINLYTDNAVIELRDIGGTWKMNRLPHSQGRPLMEALVYQPDLDRPFGKSRISRAVMSIADSAIRTAVRAEVASEFFTSPQKYILGCDDTIFADKTKWEAYIGNIIAISDNPETGSVPQFGQLSQMSMQPHTDYMRSLAMQFAGETNIPVSALGIVQDNPASAEAIRAAENYLIIEAEQLNETNGIALRNIGLLVHAIKNNTTIDKLSDVEKSIEPQFRNPSMPSAASQADAVMKRISAIPWLAESEVTLEDLGYTDSQRMRLMSDKKKARAAQELSKVREQLANSNVQGMNQEEPVKGEGNAVEE